jgi:hypothetical protein
MTYVPNDHQKNSPWVLGILMKLVNKFDILLFVTLLCNPLVALAQLGRQNPIEPFYKKQIDSLVKSGIDTVLFFRPFRAPTYEVADDSCMIDQETYIIWKKGEWVYFKKQYECRNYLKGRNSFMALFVKRPDSSRMFDYLKNNFRSVVTDTLLPGLIKVEYAGRFELVRPRSDHGGYTGIFVIVKGKVWENGYINDDLIDGKLRNVDGSVRKQQEAVNYGHNVSTFIYKMITQVEKQIAWLEEKKLFQ